MSSFVLFVLLWNIINYHPWFKKPRNNPIIFPAIVLYSILKIYYFFHIVQLHNIYIVVLNYFFLIPICSLVLFCYFVVSVSINRLALYCFLWAWFLCFNFPFVVCILLSSKSFQKGITCIISLCLPWMFVSCRYPQKTVWLVM